jgi:hypothetical protein
MDQAEGGDFTMVLLAGIKMPTVIYCTYYANSGVKMLIEKKVNLSL